MPLSRFSSAFSLIKVPLASARNHRHLLKEFVIRDVKGRFAGSMGGVLWTLINPAANIAIYIFLFSLVLRIQVTARETGTDSFVIFFLTGMFPWLIFSEGLSRSVSCLVDNANLITKVVFPVELLPLSVVLSALVVNGIGMLLFLTCLLPAGCMHVSWLLLLILISAQVVFTWGLACMLAAVCVFLRDIRELLGIALLVWFYATPIIYPFSMVPAQMRAFMTFNPMCTFVGLYRDALLVHQIHWLSVVYICIFSVVSYGIGAWFFMRAKPAFGDVL